MSEKKNKGWENLQGKKYSFANMDKTRLREISKKGAARMLEVKQEKRTAKKCLEDILNLECTEKIIAGAELPEELIEQLKGYENTLTMYDLVNLVAVGQAVGGSIRAAEYVRDTVGDTPTKQLSVEGTGLMSEADRLLLEKVERRLKNTDIMIVEDITPRD